MKSGEIVRFVPAPPHQNLEVTTGFKRVAPIFRARRNAEVA